MRLPKKEPEREDDDMEDVLKRLLEAETRAEAVVAEATARREQIIRQATEEARAAESRFEARIPEIQGAFSGKAEERAQQAIAELKRRYEERHKSLRALAERQTQEAVNAAVAILLDAEKHP
jgi:vacuolar-type H+-ATPase subunit H